MNELFALTPEGGRCGLEKLEVARENIIQVQAHVYKDTLARLAPKQKLVLQAIAREGEAQGVTSSAFIRKYNLSSASSVQAAMKSLIKHDLVVSEGESYRVYDHFFAEWLLREY